MIPRFTRWLLNRNVCGVVAASGLSAISAGALTSPAPAQDCTWLHAAKLLASDGAAFDEFGQSVSISGTTAMIGSPQDDDAGANSGSAYVFTRAGTVWTRAAKLTAADGAASDYFGASMAISGSTVLVGAIEDDDTATNSGSAYLYTG